MARARSKLERARRLCNARFERGGSLGLGGGGPVTRNAAVPVEGELWTAFVAALRVNRAAEFAAEDALLLDALGRGTLESEGWLEGVVGGVVDAGLDAAAAVGDVAAEAAAAVGMWRCSSSTARRCTARRANCLSFPTTADITATTTLVAVARRRRSFLHLPSLVRTLVDFAESANTRSKGAHALQKDERPTAPPTAPRTTGERSRSSELRRDEGAVANFTHIGTALSAALVLYLSEGTAVKRSSTRGAATSPAAAPSVSRCCCWATSATAPPSAPASPSGSPSSAAAAPTSNVSICVSSHVMTLRPSSARCSVSCSRRRAPSSPRPPSRRRG